MQGLTALQVKNAKPGRYADGRGLYLLVRPGGSRSWVLRTQVEGRRRGLGLGSTNKLSLSQARARAADLRTRLVTGQEVVLDKVAVAAPVPSFIEAARTCHEAIKAGWANRRHSDSWLASPENHFAALPYADVPPFAARPNALPETAGRDALLFTILNAVRSGETRLATWPEIDLRKAMWSIPAERMKMKKQPPPREQCVKDSLWRRLSDRGVPDDTPEADVAGRGIDRLRVARGGAVALAVIGGAQMRPAFQHLAADALVG